MELELSMKYSSSVLLSSLRRIIVLMLLLLSVFWMKKGYLELLYMTLLKWRDEVVFVSFLCDCV